MAQWIQYFCTLRVGLEGGSGGSGAFLKGFGLISKWSSKLVHGGACCLWGFGWDNPGSSKDARGNSTVPAAKFAA